MAQKELTTAQITTLLNQIVRRLARHEKQIQNMRVNAASGSFESLVTSNTGGWGSASVSWSANLEAALPLSAQTTGTGSASMSLPAEEGYAGA